MTDVNSVPASTPDPSEELLDALKDLVPSAFPDDVLDVRALLEALGESGDAPNAFSFTWPGIDIARAEARSATTATLVPDREASLDFDGARDVLVEGDNLQVLKILRSAYRGAAKLIYIDPPYNTGESFTYGDDFSVPESEYLRQTGQINVAGEVTTSRLEKAGRKHAPWLSMMFPRLVAGRHLLRRDGVFLASVDNNEVHHLRVLLDSVFGAANFVDMFTWRGARKGDAKLTGGGQDYILVYARDREWLRANDVRWRERKDGLSQIYAKADELRATCKGDFAAASKSMKEWFKSLSEDNPSKAHAHYSLIDEHGVFYPGDISSPNPRENLKYDWRGYAQPANGWRYEKSTMQRLHAEDRLIYPADKNKRIQFKGYLHEHETWAPPSVFYRDRRGASNALNDLMGAKVFDDPKSVDVLARLIQSLTDDGDLVVDFFAGSGSTGEAVWEQNSNDGTTRNWLLVQRPETPDDSEESGRNALEHGYQTIFEITAERLRRAAAARGDELGFRVFRAAPTHLFVHSPVVATESMTGDEFVRKTLEMSEPAPVKPDADEMAVAWELVLKATDTKLDAAVTIHEIDGLNVYEFESSNGSEDRLFVSLGEFTTDSAEKLELRDTDTLILRGDKVVDATTLTLAPRLRNRLVLLERVPSEVSL